MSDKIQFIPLLAEASNTSQFSMFPNENGEGVSISQNEMMELSEKYSKLYQIYIDRQSEHLIKLFDETKPVLDLLGRRALVPLVHCFLDRLVRVKRAVDIAPQALSIPNQEFSPSHDLIETFEHDAITNPAFNQAMIAFLGNIWDLPESKFLPVFSEYKPQINFKNNLFKLYARTPIYLLKKCILLLLDYLPISKIPVLTLANAQQAFFNKGFFFRFLCDVTPKWKLIIKNRDRLLRDRLFTDEFVCTAELNEFLEKLGLNKNEQQHTKQLFKYFLQTYYPSSLLESIPQNMQCATKSLQKYKTKLLLSSSGRCSLSTYMVAAAKKNGFLIVDHQHGGHYGYLKDVSVILELEYPGVDQFISWGWSQLPENIRKKDIFVTSLPSPWLSERKKYWCRLDVNSTKQFDILLMPNMVKRFTGAPQGASSSRIDLIHDMSASLLSIVRQASNKRVSILHKPYNTTTTSLLSSTLNKMEAIGGSLYFCEKQLDKGMTYELLQRCHVVVWDQPGTGFLECISSGIPTMIYWPRTYCQEEEWVQADFKELELNGIVHREVSSLVEEILKFKQSPELWMNNQERLLVVNKFCRKFAWASDDWPKHWKSYLKNIVNIFEQ